MSLAGAKFTLPVWIFMGSTATAQDNTDIDSIQPIPACRNDVLPAVAAGLDVAVCSGNYPFFTSRQFDPARFAPPLPELLQSPLEMLAGTQKWSSTFTSAAIQLLSGEDSYPAWQTRCAEVVVDATTRPGDDLDLRMPHLLSPVIQGPNQEVIFAVVRMPYRPTDPEPVVFDAMIVVVRPVDAEWDVAVAIVGPDQRIAVLSPPEPRIPPLGRPAADSCTVTLDGQPSWSWVNPVDVHDGDGSH